METPEVYALCFYSTSKYTYRRVNLRIASTT